MCVTLVYNFNNIVINPRDW